MYCRDCDYPLKELAEPRCPECGRGFDASDATSYLPKRKQRTFKRWMFYLRATVLPLALIWLFFVAWHDRATSISSEQTSSFVQVFSFLAVFFIFHGLISRAFLIPFLWIGMRLRIFLLGTVLSLLLPLCAAEGIARYEEALFVRQCQTNPASMNKHAGELWRRRWWPNDENILFYNPKTQELIDGN
ncbi:hypothetical protein OT109_04135 [Phycisphaeraceae bacterium D3-23]